MLGAVDNALGQQEVRQRDTGQQLLEPVGQLPGMDNNRQVVAQDGFVYVVSRETGMRFGTPTLPELTA